MKGWSVHFCPLDPTCRETGAPKRLYINTPWGTLMVGESAQIYDRKTGLYTQRFSRIVWRPPRGKRPPYG